MIFLNKNKYKSLNISLLKKKRKLNLTIKRILIIIISLIHIFLLSFIFIKKLRLISNHRAINNKGFLKINTAHKSKYTKYNYSDNIIVYKDLYNNISYKPITKSNFIVKSNQIANNTYFELSEKKTLLDKTLYKRSFKPKISVIIPFYNKDLFSIFIPLRSIQNQSLKDIEIIFVDDGSSENKVNEVIEEMKYDNRIILLKHKTNKGTLMSRVDGVRYASGEYILNLDQDDLYIDNLLFEKIYKKAKELNVDILQFSFFFYNSKGNIKKNSYNIPKNMLITQPDLRETFLTKIGKNRLERCATRTIWDKFVRRTIYQEAIKDLGDEYLNHRVFLYEDTLMMFELSQIAYSYYYYDILGYRLNVYNQGKSRDNSSNDIKILAMNQLHFIKLLLYKISPSYDRYIIYKEWGFAGCGSEVMSLDRSDIDLLQEVLEVIFELERLYKNTDKNLLECANKIKNHFGIE